MIYGIGVDICSIARMEKNSTSFFRKYYTEQEINYCAERYTSLAGVFSAKEAFVKALGTGFINIDLKSIEVVHDSLGAPFYKVNNWAEEELVKRGIKKTHLTITHDAGIAEAFCILEC